MKNKIIIIISLAIIAMVLYTNTAFGQPFAPPDGTTGGGPVGAPIDGGISALIAGGAALIVRKYRKSKKENENQK